MVPKIIEFFLQFYESVVVMREQLGADVLRCVGYGHVGDGNMHLNITTKYVHQWLPTVASVDQFLLESPTVNLLVCLASLAEYPMLNYAQRCGLVS